MYHFKTLKLELLWSILYTYGQFSSTENETAKGELPVKKSPSNTHFLYLDNDGCFLIFAYVVRKQLGFFQLLSRPP